MTIWYEFEEVDTFTTGAIGEPGQRVFYLQLRTGRRQVAVKCEKQQVAAIATHLHRVLVDLPPPEDGPLPASLELATPVDPEFVLGAIGLGYERTSDRIVVQLEEFTAADDDIDDEAIDDEADQSTIRIHLTRAQATAFCAHAEDVVAAGRSTCRWCMSPIDPDGHPCPRMN